MDLQLIKFYCERRPGGIRQLADDVKMSEANLHRCIRLNKIQASDLEKIAELLNVNVGVFFGEEASIHVEAHDNGQAAGRDIHIESADTVRLKEKIAHLEQRIKDKDNSLRDKDNSLKDKDALIQILKKNN
jgi:DNA-binding Xre family transcriptional regulator